MIRSLWTAATVMNAQSMEQDIIANNLANVNTTGFKRSRVDFQDLMYQIGSKSGTETTAGVRLPTGIEVGMGVKVVSIQKLFNQGDFQQTGNQFDWAIEGEGFFQLDNNGQTVYSRAGNWKIDKNGMLVNSDGLKLLPNVTIPTAAVTFTVDKSGTWSATDKAGTVISSGSLQLARFINPGGLTSLGRNTYEKSESSGDPQLGTPGVEGNGTIAQFTLEMSNVSVIEEMIKMIAGQRAYEIDSKAVQTADTMLSLVANLKR
ncbi:MAG TPA: flagellar basal-body rod protein FlgG [Syntrophus sp. (in: bacteria)]|nr:flagellar basal-body rod protein FlgG [Syntrophus sp. (in: bacteria)]